MKSYLISSLSVIFLLLLISKSIGQLKADTILQDFIEESKAVGVVAGYSKGTSAWSGGKGFLNQEKQLKANPQMLVRIASISKTMTAVAIMQLKENELLELDSPIQNYIPNFPTKPEGVITTRHLLNHSSGISHYKNAKERENTTQYPDVTDAVKIFEDRKLIGNPGEKYNYSTYGYVLLGRIIEQVSGMTYESYMQKHIWNKAGMKSTGVEQHDFVYTNKSELYHKSQKGKVTLTAKTNLSDRIPAGGIYSTSEDVLKFGQALMDGKLISKGSFEEMMEDSGLKREGNPYGFGLYLYGQNPRYGNVIGHSGTQTGCSAQLMILPEQDVVIFVAANTSGVWEDVFGLTVKLFGVASED